MPGRAAAALAIGVVLAACSGEHKESPGLKHAKAACATWAKLNLGIADTTKRQQASETFQREATAAATAEAKYKALQSAAESWTFAQAAPTAGGSIDALRSAIDQSRAACAGVPTK